MILASENKVGNAFYHGEKYIKPAMVGAIHRKQDMIGGEKKNCTVRALANCTSKSYDTCHTVLQQAGRKNNEGCTAEVYLPVYLKHGAKKLTVVGTTTQANWHVDNYRKITGEYPEQIKGMTIKTFLSNPEYQRGVYAVEVRGHIFTVISGLVYDVGMNLSNQRICAIIEF